MTEEPTIREIPLVWDEIEDKEIVFINELLVQPGQYGEILLTFGQSAPPVILGQTEEERVEQLGQISQLPVKPIARFALTPITFQRFAQALQLVLANYEQIAQQLQAQAQQTTEEGGDGGANAR